MPLLTPGLQLVTVRAALLCVACDMPATKKTLGFSSFNSSHGCSKCHHHFPYMKEHDKRDFSDFEYRNWVPRKLENHRELSEKFCEAETKSKQKKFLQDHGV